MFGQVVVTRPCPAFSAPITKLYVFGLWQVGMVLYRIGPEYPSMNVPVVVE